MSSTLSLQEIESKFQDLYPQLNLNISPRLKSRLLGNFCDLLVQRSHQEINHSYFQQLLPALIEHLTLDALEYQPPQLLHSLFKTMVYMDRSSEFHTHRSKFQKALKNIRYRTSATFFYVGEWELGFQTIVSGSEIPIDLAQLDKIQEMEHLAESECTKSLPEKEAGVVQKILSEWESRRSGYSNREVWIPLVEKYTFSPDREMIVGTLYPLQLDLEQRQRDKTRDLIFFNNHPIGIDDLVNYQAQDAIRAARAQHPLLRRSKTTRYSVLFGFPESNYFYSGSSFGLGMSLLSLCALEEQSNLRNQHFISKAASYTGGVDLHGEIRPVNYDSLYEKISAAFFSPLDTFVLPDENLERGNEIVDEIKNNYPRKNFNLTGEKSIDPSLQKTKLIVHKRMPLLTWMKNHLTRNTIIQIISSLVLFILVAWTAIGYFQDPNPSKFEVEGQILRMYNKHGSFLWDLDLGFSPQNLDADRIGKPEFKRIQMGDYDGDGETEILLGSAIKNRDWGGKLFFIETDGSIKWVYDNHPILEFGGNEYSDTYSVSFIFPYKHKDSDNYDIYVNFSHRPWFPNRLLRFDIDGNILNSFIHPGGIYDFEIFDTNGDGELEILLGGTNNRFNSAVLAILPSRNFTGSVPSVADSSCVLDGGIVDSTLIYFRFPHWGKYDFTGSNARSHLSDIYQDSKSGFGVNTTLGGSLATGAYIFHFNFDLQLDGLALSDGTLSRYYSLKGNAFFDDYDPSEWRSDMSKIEIWSDGGWKPIDVIIDY